VLIVLRHIFAGKLRNLLTPYDVVTQDRRAIDRHDRRQSSAPLHVADRMFTAKRYLAINRELLRAGERVSANHS
jgi:hypothetical protein